MARCSADASSVIRATPAGGRRLARDGGGYGTAADAIAPLLSGAVAAAAGMMLIGWPHRPPLPGQAGAVAAVALVMVAVLLVFAPAMRPRRTPSDGAVDRLVAAGADPDRAHRSTGQLLDPLDVGACVGREVVEGAAGGEVFKPAG
jgi:hypothetical protein